MAFLGRYDALESRLESLRAEKRSARDVPSHVVQKQLEELAQKDSLFSRLQVRLKSISSTVTRSIRGNNLAVLGQINAMHSPCIGRSLQ